MASPLRVLIIEESEADALLLTLELKRGGYDPIHERAGTAAALSASLREKPWDVILCNYPLPGFNGLDALVILKDAGLNIPFIIVSDMIGEEEIIEVVKAGAHDCIRKDRLQRLVPAVKRELREAALRRERQSGAAALAEGERKFHLFVENAPEAIYVQVQYRFAYLNPAAVRLFGAESAESLLGRPVLERVHPAYRETVRERMRLSSEERKTTPIIEQQFRRMDGSVVDVEVSAVPFLYENQSGGLVFVRDITDRKQAEAERRRGQESSERLAREMAVIAEIGRVIGSSLDIEEVYERFAAEARKLIPFDSLMINLIKQQENALVIAYVSGMDIPARRPGDRIPFQGSFCEAITAARKGLILQSEGPREIMRRFPSLTHVLKAGLRSMMAVPLISRDRAIGALIFWSKKKDLYTEGLLNLAERVGTQIAGAVANADLFTDLKMTEGSLRESETRLRAIFDQAAVGVAEIEIATNRFLSANRRFCAMIGMTEEELRATNFLTITHPEDRRVHEDKIAQLVAGQIDQCTLEKRYVRKDGSILWVNLAISPLWKPGGVPCHNLVVVQDITESKRMSEEIAHRSRQLAVLHDTSLDLMAELNLNTLLHSIVQRALSLIGGGTMCNCYLYRPDADRLEQVASAGQGPVSRKTTLQRGEGAVGVIWETSAPLLINNYRSWPRRIRSYRSAMPRAVIGAPIRWGGGFLGVLTVVADRVNPFSPMDIETLDMFATLAAITIRNARLYQQIEQTAITDELTGLFNRRGFLQLGEREFDRAIRFRSPLAALMVDIDHFKAINDTCGHSVGDRVLQAFTQCFHSNTRGIDVVSRYGGEEFVLLLPETPLTGAIQIAERLRQSIATLSIPAIPSDGASAEAGVQVTASIGVACVTPETCSLAAVIDRADQAQYCAKRSGRNCVRTWEGLERPPGKNAAV